MTTKYAGKDKVLCLECHGDKLIKCEKCNGSGKFSTCNRCNSTGKTNCPDCGGSGKALSVCPVCVNGEVYKTRWINCAGCHGTGRRRVLKGINRGEIVSCWECGGRGQVKEKYKDICPNCHGEYERETDKPCKKCGGTGKAKCSRCDGTGHAECQACRGRGKVKCAKCGGEGYVSVDNAMSVKLMQEAARDGNLQALHDLGVAYALGQCGLAVDCGRAEECFKEILKHKDDEEYDYYADSAGGHLKYLGAVCKGDANAMRELANWFGDDEMECRGIDGSPMINGVNPNKFWKEMAVKAEKQVNTDATKKSTSKSSSGSTRTSTKKRWKFVVLGLLFGYFGLHLAYAKRWFLFLLLWAGFIVGGVMSGGKGEPEKLPTEAETTQVAQSDNKGKKDSGSPISGIGFAVWALLWIGGTLFIKKDGKGNRM